MSKYKNAYLVCVFFFVFVTVPVEGIAVVASKPGIGGNTSPRRVVASPQNPEFSATMRTADPPLGRFRPSGFDVPTSAAYQSQ